MSKPFATAVVTGKPFCSYDGEQEVQVRRCTARRCTAQFHAPGWRPMAFTTVEAAKAKMERHPGFVRWAA